MLDIYPNLVGQNDLKEGQDKPVGMYREVKDFIPRLAEFYLTVNQHRIDKLLDFKKYTKKDSSSFLFCIAFGGDGAPGVGTVFSVSFINVGKRILSSSETFMVFGGEVDECELSSRRFVQRAIKDFIYLESKVFKISINGTDMKVEFKLCELPNDMKFLCFLAGELNNAATYFTTFANVSKHDSRDHTKSFGNGWEPFSYKKRLQDSSLVGNKRKSWEKLAETTRKSKINDFIKSLNSRQCEEPLVEHFVDIMKSDGLHLKNNVCKDLFIKIWKILFFFLPVMA